MAYVAKYLQLLAAGDFNSALDHHKLQELFTHDIKLDVKVKLLKLLTKAICDKTITNNAYDDNIFYICEHMLQSLQNEAENIDESILSCIYYIAKHFLKQENLELAWKLKPFVLSLKIEVTENVIKVYYGIFYEFHSYLKEHKDIPCDTKLKILCESLEILSQCGGKYLPTIFSELDQFSSCDGTISVRQESIVYIFSLVDTILKNSTVDDQCQVICSWYTQCVSRIIPFVINDPLILEKVLCKMNIFQTSSVTCDKLMNFFITSIKAVLKSSLSLPEIQEQISVLKNFLVSESNLLLHCVCTRFARIYYFVQSNWLKTLSIDFCLKEFVGICELGLLLSKCCIRKYTTEQEISYGDSLRNIVLLIPLGINVVLSRVEECGKNTEAVEDTLNVFKKLLFVQTQCYEHFLILKSSITVFWKDTWKVLASRICSLASLLERKCYYDFACDMYKNVCSAFFTLEEIEDLSTLICPLEVILKAFKGLSQCFVHQLKPKEALISISIPVLFFPENCATLQKLWMLTKKNACDDKSCVIDQKFTMCNIFQEMNSTIQLMFPLAFSRIQTEFNHSKIYQLLLWELQSYFLNSDEMFESICEVSRFLILHPHDSISFAQCIVLAMRGIWRQMGTFGSESFQRLCEIGLKALTNLNKDTDWQILSLMGDIYFYKFWAEISVLRRRLHDEVTNMKNRYPTREEKSIMKGFTDAAEAGMKSNIVTMYSGLNIDKEQELLKLLLQAVEFWFKVLNVELNITQYTQGYVDTLLLNIKSAALLFALYGYYVHSLKVWKMYYSLCKALKDNLEIMFALSQLLTFSSYLPDGKFWKEADRLEEDILKEMDLGNRQKEVLINYWLTKCSSCLMNNQFDVGWQCLLKIDSVPRTFVGRLCYSKKNILLSKYFLFCPHPSKVPKSFKDGNPFLAIGEALGNVKALCQNGNLEPLFEKCSLHLLQMETSEWMGDLWLGGKFYRDGYVYLKEDLTLAQMLGLASRCSLIVSKLTQFDLMCWETDNLQIKLLGLEAMLCLNAVSAPSFKFYETALEEQTESYMRENTLDQDLMAVKLLDIPEPTRFAVMSSPNLKSSPFKIPYIANHEDDCLCFSCHSSILQSVFVDVSHFRAHVHVFKGENELALTFFKGGLKLGEHFKKKLENFTLTLTSSVFLENNFSLIPFSHQLCASLAKLALSFEEFVFLCSKFKPVEKITLCPEHEFENPLSCNLHLVLNVLDRILLMNSEMDALPKADEKVKRQLGCDFEQSSCKETDSQATTPSLSCKQLLQAPARNRNEEYLRISRLASPSLLVNLKSKLKEENICKREEGKNISQTQGKLNKFRNDRTKSKKETLPKIPNQIEDHARSRRKIVKTNVQVLPPLEIDISDDIFTCKSRSKQVSDLGELFCTPINSKERIPGKNSKLIFSDSETYNVQDKCHAKDKSEDVLCDKFENISLGVHRKANANSKTGLKKQGKRVLYPSDSSDSFVESSSDNIIERKPDKQFETRKQVPLEECKSSASTRHAHTLKKQGKIVLFPSDSSDSVIESPSDNIIEVKPDIQFETRKQVSVEKCKSFASTRHTRQRKCSIDIIVAPNKSIPINNENKCYSPKSARSSKQKHLKGPSLTCNTSNSDVLGKMSPINCTNSVAKSLRCRKKNTENLETLNPLAERNELGNQAPLHSRDEDHLDDVYDVKKSLKKSTRRRKCPFILN